MNLLRVDGSMRREGSISRQLTDELIASLQPTTVVTRDLAADPLPHLSEDWIAANFTAAEDRTAAQREVLGLSDRLVQEVRAADVLAIGLPIYNFAPPSAVKAWVDHICRARLTFRYGENGPVGLMTGKSAYLVVASGGTAAEAPIDFATGYMKHALGFIGITDVAVVDASAHMRGLDEALLRARGKIAA